MKGLVTFAREQLGVDLFPGQVEVLEAWEASAKRKAVLALGRRSGKGLMAAVAAIHNATIADYSDMLRPGERRYIVVVATKLQQAREFVRVVRELLASASDPDLAALIDEQASTLDEVVFRTGVVIRSMPCSSRSTRGLAISLLVMDEAAHMTSTEDGFAAGKRVYQALLPSTAQFGERGYVMLTSSPLWASGVFHELYQAGVSGMVEDIFTVRRPTWEMNPNISRESLGAEFLGDPEGAATEYGAEFMDGAGAYLEPGAIQDCIAHGRRSFPPMPGLQYVAAADPAFAAGGDAFTFAIGHRMGPAGDFDKSRYVVDRLHAWRGRRSPLNSDQVLDEITAICREYGVSEIVSDQYSLVPLTDAFRRRGITLRGQPLTNELKADVFGSLKRAINTGRVELLDDPALVAELIHLEVRPTPGGKPRIAASGSFKDDRAMAVATLVHAMAIGGEYELAMAYFDRVNAAPEQQELAARYLEQINGAEVDAYLRQITGADPTAAPAGNADDPTLAAAIRTPGGF